MRSPLVRVAILALVIGAVAGLAYCLRGRTSPPLPPPVVELLRQYGGAPRDEREALALAHACLHAGAVEEAERRYAAVFAARPEWSEAALGLAACALERGDLAAARSQVDQARRGDGSDGRLLNDYALLLIRYRRHPEALAVFREALGLAPADAQILMNAAQHAQKLREYALAREWGYLALRAQPRQLAPRILLCEVFLESGASGGAGEEARLRAALAEFESSGAAQEMLGRLALWRGDKTAAYAAFQRAREILPDWSEPHRQLGRLALRAKNYPEARAHFEQAHRRAPASWSARAGLAETLVAEGREAEAVATYEAILSDHPDAAAALNNLAELLGRRAEDRPRALDLARRAAALAPEDAAVLDTLGELLFRAGRAGEALDPLRRSVTLRPTAALPHLHLGWVYEALNDPDQARREFRVALDLGLPEPDAALVRQKLED